MNNKYEERKGTQNILGTSVHGIENKSLVSSGITLPPHLLLPYFSLSS